MKDTGHLVISLDFELLWGIFDKTDYEEKKKYFERTYEIIPEILQLFDTYEIHATWAVVGMLFNNSWREWKENIPGTLPEYSKPRLSAYNYGNSLIKIPGTEKHVFARDLIREIQRTPFQEIGTHTYSHYYCLEPGQNTRSFRADLQKSIVLAEGMNIKLKSLVFPRNQYNEKYLEVCRELGIENVRSNPENWYWKNIQEDTLLSKIFRTGDAYLGFKNKSYSFKQKNDNPLPQKASRLLRPYSTNRILNSLKVKRIKSEITHAARRKQVYHLWWHPHNFAEHPEENMRDLKIILEHYIKCRRKYNFRSSNMREINKFFSFERR